MKEVREVVKKLGLKVEFFRDLQDFEEYNNRLYKFPVIMRAETCLKLSELVENSKKSGEQEWGDLTDGQRADGLTAVQLEKAISLLHGLTFHRDKQLYADLEDAQGKERRVKLIVEDA